MPRQKLTQEQKDANRIKREIKARNKELITMVSPSGKINKEKLELNYDYIKPKVKIPKEKKIRYSLGKERKILLTKKNEAQEKTKKITSKAIQDQIEGLNDKLKNDAAMFNKKLVEYKKTHKLKGTFKGFKPVEYHAFMKKIIKKRLTRSQFDELLI